MGYRLRHKEINVYTRLDGDIVVIADDKELSYETMDLKNSRYQADSKEIKALVDALVHANKVLPTGSTAQTQCAP